MKRKWLSLLALLCVGACFAGVACGEDESPTVGEEPIEEGPIEYTLNEDKNGYTLSDVGYDFAEEKLVIPASYKGLPVTGIDEFAFNDEVTLKEVTIPDSVTTIGGFAFKGCILLEKVTIGSGVTELGDYIFTDCTLLKDVTLKEGLKYIGGSMFSRCSALRAIDIPNSVTEIKEHAFRGAGLEEIELPTGLLSIGGSAFSDTSLTSVHIPQSVKTIGDYAFSCDVLTSVVWDNGAETVGSGIFGTNLKNITVNGGTLKKDWGADAENCILNGVVLEEEVFMFGDIKTLTLNNVKTIPQKAFYTCSDLQSVTITGETTSIGESAFNGCKNLIEIRISASVKEIGERAFSGCTVLVRAYFDDAYGWWVDDDINLVMLKEGDMSDAAKAAKYLRDTYVHYTWGKSLIGA